MFGNLNRLWTLHRRSHCTEDLHSPVECLKDMLISDFLEQPPENSSALQSSGLVGLNPGKHLQSEPLLLMLQVANTPQKLYTLQLSLGSAHCKDQPTSLLSQIYNCICPDEFINSLGLWYEGRIGKFAAPKFDSKKYTTVGIPLKLVNPSPTPPFQKSVLNPHPFSSQEEKYRLDGQNFAIKFFRKDYQSELSSLAVLFDLEGVGSSGVEKHVAPLPSRA
nr:hypothetical protein Iba_chr09aCG3560 [Ipomoea batatas]